MKADRPKVWIAVSSLLYMEVLAVLGYFETYNSSSSEVLSNLRAYVEAERIVDRLEVELELVAELGIVLAVEELL
jgi:hypothetical protein